MLLQNRISQSRLSLPVTALYAIGVWMSCGLLAYNLWQQFACFVVSSYLMVELNNSNALIRIYSRMVSCSFMMMMCMSTFLLQSVGAMLLSICMVMMFIMVFQTYQDQYSMGRTFYSFLSLGMASLIDARVMCYVPVMWLAMYFHLRSMTLRNLFSSLFGLICPYWFFSLYLIYMSDYTPLLEHFAELGKLRPVADFSQIPHGVLVSFAFIALLSVTGVIHYLRNRIGDKTRTRMLYSTLILFDISTIVFMILQPQCYVIWLTMLIVTASPLIAHFIALTHTKVTDITFKVIVTAVLALTFINIMQLI